MRRKLIATTVVAVGASIAVLGCGGANDSTAETVTALTKAQYLKQADAICAETESRQLARMEGIEGTPGRATSLKLVRQAGLPPLQVQAEELEALAAPAELERQIVAFQVAFEAGLEETEANPTILLDGKPFAEAEQLAKAAGLKVCGGA